MDKVSRIRGRKYTLIEQLPALVGEAGYVICEDAEGKRLVCPEELCWKMYRRRSRLRLSAPTALRRRK